MNGASVAERTPRREQAEPRPIYVHGDFIEEWQPTKWSEPQSGYLCRACDLILPADHFRKAHTRRQHMARYFADVKRLARLASRGAVSRDADADEVNLIERAMLGESERTRLGVLEPEPERRSLLDELKAAGAATA